MLGVLTTSVILLAATGVALAQTPVSNVCNDTYKQFLSHPGYQPDAEINTPCGVSTITVHVKVTAEGGIVIVDGGIEGSISVTIQTPSTCPSQKLFIAEDLHYCGLDLIGWHCNPEGRQVPINLYGSDDPCPSIPTGEDLINLIASAVVGGTIPNIPITVPCSSLTDITDTLPPSARFRWTAKATKCKSQRSAEQTTYMEDFEALNGNGTVCGLFGGIVPGNPTQYDFESLVPQGERLGGLTVVEGLDDLAALFDSGSSDQQVVIDLMSSHASIDWIDDLSIRVQTDTLLANGEWISNDRLFHGSFRANGDFAVHAPGVIEPGEEGQIPSFYTLSYTRIGELVFSMLEGSDSAMVHPGVNGAATSLFQGPLSDLAPALNWLQNPFGLLGGAVVRHELHGTQEEDRIEIVQTIPVTFEEGATANELTRALFGHGWKYAVDVSEGARVLQIERFDIETGMVSKRVICGSHREVTPGTWRPMSMRILEFKPTGMPNRVRDITFSGGHHSGQQPGEIPVPRPAENTWFVQIR